jgi:hypothetical protein
MPSRGWQWFSLAALATVVCREGAPGRGSGPAVTGVEAAVDRGEGGADRGGGGVDRGGGGANRGGCGADRAGADTGRTSSTREDRGLRRWAVWSSAVGGASPASVAVVSGVCGRGRRWATDSAFERKR